MSKGQTEVKGASHVTICQKRLPGRGNKFKGLEVYKVVTVAG